VSPITWLQVSDGAPLSLSTTPAGNLLVTCRAPNKLVELSADGGQQVREVVLQADIEFDWSCHSVKLGSGAVVVCHGDYETHLHRTCLMVHGGSVTVIYGGRRGSGAEHLDHPRHLAVDSDSQHVFVADDRNHRVVLLSPALEFIRYVGEGFAEGVVNPTRLHFDCASRRLYIAQGQTFGHGVTVIQL